MVMDSASSHGWLPFPVPAVRRRFRLLFLRLFFCRAVGTESCGVRDGGARAPLELHTDFRVRRYPGTIRHDKADHTSGQPTLRPNSPVSVAEPLQQRNVLRVLHSVKRMGSHVFRRFRLTWLRKNGAPKDLERFWMGHAPEEVGALYSKLKEDVAFRQEWARRIGFPSTKLSTVAALQTRGRLSMPKVPRLVQHRLEFPAIG